MISCDEAALICSKSQYHEASFREKLKLRLHMLFCGTCSAFSKRNKQLSSLFSRARLQVLSDATKQELKQQIQNRQ
jgi:hypothetical protein